MRRSLSLVIAGVMAAGCAPPMPPRASPAEPTVSPDGPIVVLGDTQRTSWAEEFLAGREQNELGRRNLVEKIATEERPAFVVHVGDLVVEGDSRLDWQYFDLLTSSLAVRKVPIHPVVGNHDYWGDKGEALRLLRARFPEFPEDRTYYARLHRGLGLVWLDSNLKKTSAREQATWLARVLADFDAASNVRGVVVFVHHPPFTNATRVGGRGNVQADVLPGFLAARKTRVMMSGHVHGYERFVHEGRTFVVTGGAGGPRVQYRVGAAAVTPAAYVTASGAKRAFNYVVMRDAGSALEFEVKCLALDAPCSGGVLERFRVDLPPP